jgi:hypothetical protein
MISINNNEDEQVPLLEQDDGVVHYGGIGNNEAVAAHGQNADLLAVPPRGPGIVSPVQVPDPDRNQGTPDTAEHVTAEEGTLGEAREIFPTNQLQDPVDTNQAPTVANAERGEEEPTVGRSEDESIQNNRESDAVETNRGHADANSGRGGGEQPQIGSSSGHDRRCFPLLAVICTLSFWFALLSAVHTLLERTLGYNYLNLNLNLEFLGDWAIVITLLFSPGMSFFANLFSALTVQSDIKKLEDLLGALFQVTNSKGMQDKTDNDLKEVLVEAMEQKFDALKQDILTGTSEKVDAAKKEILTETSKKVDAAKKEILTETSKKADTAKKEILIETGEQVDTAKEDILTGTSEKVDAAKKEILIEMNSLKEDLKKLLNAREKERSKNF